MFGYFLGIPAGFIALVAGLRFLPEYFHSWQIGWGLAICCALIVYNFFRGIDILNEQKLDNPPPFDVPKSAPEVFGTIHESLKETQYGPWSWNTRTQDVDTLRLVMVMTFREITQSYFEVGRLQLERLIMLTIMCEPVEISNPLKPEEKTPGTRVQLRWVVDSPANRNKVNEIIRETTAELQHLLGVKEIERKTPRHPMAPPEWLTVTAATLVIFGFYNHDEVEKQIEQRRVAQEQARQAQEAERERLQREREEQIADYKRKQEEQLKKWQEQQQQNTNQGSGVSPYNPFAPALGGGSSFEPMQNNQPSITKPWETGSSSRLDDWLKKSTSDYGSVAPNLTPAPGWQSNTPTERPSWRAPYGGSGNPGGDSTTNTGPYGSNGQRWRAGGQ